jgi:peptide/nickel transport system substrate-binding protein
VTCADGSPMDAKVVADNINYVGDAKNESPMAGVALPAGAKATADTAAGTVEVTLPGDAPFFMQNLAELPLVCAKGLADRKTLKSASSGSGPYVLSNAVPGDHYDYVLRKGYAWGPNGARTSTPGMPAKVTFKVVTSPTTTANLLVSGQLNVAQVSGADTTRLKSAGLFSAGSQFIGQEIAFNESPDQAVSDVAVRRALIAALNLPDLAKVDSGNLGQQANGLIADPKICGGDTMKGNTPAFDVEGAKTALDQAGWTAGAGGIRAKGGKRLSVSLIYPNESPTTSASAEYIAGQWKKLGVDVKLNEQSFDQTSAVVFGKGAWGATMIGLGVSNPATLVPFFSGPSPTKGNNFGHFDNAQYDAHVASAQSKDGTAGCPDWNAAESALFKDADITPISTKPFLYWGKKVTFKVIAHILQPTSLRALAG